MKKLKLITLATIALVCASCSQQQAANVENAVFTADQVGCLMLNSGMFGDSNAVTELETACKLSPALESAMTSVINSWVAGKARAAAAAKK